MLGALWKIIYRV